MRKHLLSFFLLVISLVCRAHDGENFVASDLFASLQPGDKAALLMVHFGTTHDDTRALTIAPLKSSWHRETKPDRSLGKVKG